MQTELTAKHQPRLVVGIGTSAGGLNALKHLFSILPQESGLAFIVVQHLAPDHNSMLAELLLKESPILVCEAEDGAEIFANRAYVIPPGCHLEVVDGRLKVLYPTDRLGQRVAIDHLLRSLARAYASRAAGVLLTGSGTVLADLSAIDLGKAAVRDALGRARDAHAVRLDRVVDAHGLDLERSHAHYLALDPGRHEWLELAEAILWGAAKDAGANPRDPPERVL